MAGRSSGSFCCQSGAVRTTGAGVPEEGLDCARPWARGSFSVRQDAQALRSYHSRQPCLFSSSSSAIPPSSASRPLLTAPVHKAASDFDLSQLSLSSLTFRPVKPSDYRQLQQLHEELFPFKYEHTFYDFVCVGSCFSLAAVLSKKNLQRLPRISPVETELPCSSSLGSLLPSHSSYESVSVGNGARVPGEGREVPVSKRTCFVTQAAGPPCQVDSAHVTSPGHVGGGMRVSSPSQGCGGQARATDTNIQAGYPASEGWSAGTGQLGGRRHSGQEEKEGVSPTSDCGVRAPNKMEEMAVFTGGDTRSERGGERLGGHMGASGTVSGASALSAASHQEAAHHQQEVPKSTRGGQGFPGGSTERGERVGVVSDAKSSHSRSKEGFLHRQTASARLPSHAPDGPTESEARAPRSVPPGEQEEEEEDEEYLVGIITVSQKVHHIGSHEATCVRKWFRWKRECARMGTEHQAETAAPDAERMTSRGERTSVCCGHAVGSQGRGPSSGTSWRLSSMLTERLHSNTSGSTSRSNKMHEEWDNDNETGDSGIRERGQTPCTTWVEAGPQASTGARRASSSERNMGFEADVYRSSAAAKNEKDLSLEESSPRSASAGLSFPHLQSDEAVADLAYILTLGVAEEFRQKGLAQELVQRTLAYYSCPCVNSRPTDAIFLHVVDYNRAALHFYEKQHFERLDHIRDFYQIHGCLHGALLYAYDLSQFTPCCGCGMGAAGRFGLRSRVAGHSHGRGSSAVLWSLAGVQHAFRKVGETLGHFWNPHHLGLHHHKDDRDEQTAYEHRLHERRARSPSPGVAHSVVGEVPNKAGQRNGGW
ncbi:gnat family protein [Cystoisospora suis]|uniref:N-alpha-acetyltransferase 60 n=1 Tax=Cystoisospora suis TaxID=483139 RepID=A0A2C6JYS8_9APIC|nr:gnat family protein [Cystoisospora suis]